MVEAREPPIDKRALRRALDRAARTFATADHVYREVGARLAGRLDFIKIEPRVIVDAGCALGADAKELSRRYPRATLIAFDIAPALVAAARGDSPWWQRHLPLGATARYLCADLEALPLAGGSADLIWSNLVLHWYDLAASLHEAHRVLRTGGLVLFATLGPDTLKELGNAFAGICGDAHVNRFIDMHDIGDALVHAGFADPVMEMEMLSVTYDNLERLAGDLKSVGASNHLRERAHGLMTPRRWRDAAQRYEAMRRDGKLPATLELVFGHAWKPEPRATRDGLGIVRFHPSRRA